jgi:hypothetical protein
VQAGGSFVGEVHGAVDEPHEGQEACVCDLTNPVGLSQPTVPHHLKVLVDAGLLTRDKRGVWAYYRLVPERLAQVAAALNVSADRQQGVEPMPCPPAAGTVDVSTWSAPHNLETGLTHQEPAHRSPPRVPLLPPPPTRAR